MVQKIRRHQGIHLWVGGEGPEKQILAKGHWTLDTALDTGQMETKKTGHEFRVLTFEIFTPKKTPRFEDTCITGNNKNPPD